MGLSFVRRLLIAVLLLLVASCTGGGCSSGCASCGIAPLPGGFPKPETIPNAGAVRVTRPGLDFVQENLSTLATKALGNNVKNGILAFQIPKGSQSGAEVCPPANPVPPQCTAEVGIGTMKVRVNAITPNRVKLDGRLPVRIRDLPVKFSFYNAYVVAGDASKAPNGNLCTSSLRGSASFPYKEFPINIELPLVTETRVPRTGYTKVDLANAVIDIGITENDVEICDGSGCGGFCQGFLDFIKSFAFDSLVNGVKNQIREALSGAFCTAPSPMVTPPCPTGSEPNDPDLAKATRCEFIGGDECVPGLLGADGRMNLAQALASFSPGTTGGLDFVLASAGDMNPAPRDATLPAWTPRKPPVPAEDNNDNGISLSLTGGALPQPMTSCVKIVRRDPPKDIPIPKELTDDSSGTHLGVALAGRYLEHALLGAYNSGALCLGLTTETVTQLSSGTLSLLAPSLKSMTLEGENAAAGISTRPGAPPKLVIGAAPLLSLTLEKLAVDFHVFSFDRFVRIFTYTADVTVPIDLQTGKDPVKNPNGGLLPVLGDIKVTNASVSNNALLFEDDARLADGVTGLLAGIVGQFLGGGLSPIDLSSALASTGLALDIPPNGIRKLTSGGDDFLAVFANLKAAPATAREEADTRAVLLEKIVDPSVMAIDTAVRARFPKLRVRVQGVASRPTEHTWWIDEGPHAKWTTAEEILVDQDAMLLQGKHVLHVSSRIVGEMSSEDTTPAEIPFVIDTLAPQIDVTHEQGRIVVDAWDFVSPADALRIRYRERDGDFTEWEHAREVPKTAIDVEAIDEEGNIGRVSLALRGRGDPTLAGAGSGCGCRTTQARDASPLAAAAVAVALGAALARRRRRRNVS